MANLVPKMDPKSDPKGPRPTSPKLAPAWPDRMWTPPVDDPFSLPKPTLEKDPQKTRKNTTKYVFGGFWSILGSILGGLWGKFLTFSLFFTTPAPKAAQRAQGAPPASK